jgi:hypothetical protein
MPLLFVNLLNEMQDSCFWFFSATVVLSLFRTLSNVFLKSLKILKLKYHNVTKDGSLEIKTKETSIPILLDPAYRGISDL